MNEKSFDINENFESDAVSYEEIDIVENEGIADESLLSKAARAVFYGFLLLLPVWFLPATVAQVNINKGFFAALALLVSFMLALGGILQDGRIKFPSARVFPFYMLFALVWLVSSIFSVDPTVSLWGTGGEPTTFINILLGGVALFLTPLVLRDKPHIKKAFFFIGSSFLLALFLFFLHSVFGLNIFPWDFARARSFNTFGSWNALAVFFGAGTVFFLPFVGSRLSGFFKYSPVWFGLLLLGVFFTNFLYVWVAIGIIALFFLALTMSQREHRSKMFAVSLVLLMVSVLLFLLSGALDSSISNNFGKPQEASLNFGGTVSIIKGALSGSPVLGSGPNTFGLFWERFKDASVNSTIFWRVRFNNGASTFLTMLLEGGIAGMLAMALFIATFIFSAIKALASVGDSEHHIVKSTFAASLLLLIAFMAYSVNSALLMLLLVFVGMFYAALQSAGAIESREINLFKSRERGFVFSLLIMFLLVGSIVGLYLESTRYMGQVIFARGVEMFNEDGSANGAEKAMRRAASLDPWQASYWRTIAQLELVKLQRAFKNTSVDTAERNKRVSDSFNKARNAASQAVKVGPEDPNNHRMLARVYEAAIPIDKSVAERAIENYKRALEKSPVDPSILFDIARVHLSVADIATIQKAPDAASIAGAERDSAIEFLSKAVGLKPDYTEAHFTLSRLYEIQNRMDEAIRNGELALRLAPDDIGVQFQLGLLYYKAKNFGRARALFEAAVGKNENYSNARYFLGLIYDQAGNKELALEQFKKIIELNPNANEVKKIIESLENGGSAQDVIGVPPPEEREVAPIDESASGGLPLP